MLTLGIDTSNYATSLAVFDTDAGEVVCDCKKFLPVKEGQLGLRQSDALFHHTAALPAMLAELGARADLTQVRAVGVSARPRPVEGSYMPCFLAGVSAATAFSLSRALPLIELTHQQCGGQCQGQNQCRKLFHVEIPSLCSNKTTAQGKLRGSYYTWVPGKMQVGVAALQGAASPTPRRGLPQQPMDGEATQTAAA